MKIIDKVYHLLLGVLLLATATRDPNGTPTRFRFGRLRWTDLVAVIAAMPR